MHFLFITTICAFAAVSSSCSPSIYASGRHADVLAQGKSRSEIRSSLGKPVESGRVNGDIARISPGSTYDKFQVRGPVYDIYLTTGASMGTAMTFGLLEFISFPSAVWWKLTSRGLYDVIVTYNAETKYTWHYVTKSLLENRKSEQDSTPNN